jgi:predicted transcriptional regulator
MTEPEEDAEFMAYLRRAVEASTAEVDVEAGLRQVQDEYARRLALGDLPEEPR